MIERYQYDAALHVIINAKEAIKELIKLPSTLESIIADITDDQKETLRNEFEDLVQVFKKVTEGSYE